MVSRQNTSFFDDSVPKSFREILDRINNPEGATIYGAVLECLFALGCLIDPGNERLLRLFWAAANLGLTALPPLHIVFGAVLLVAPVVNPWYLLWGLPAAVTSRAAWPWTASFALLFSYVTGDNLGFPSLDPFAVHPLSYWLQWSLTLGAIGFAIRHYRPTA